MIADLQALPKVQNIGRDLGRRHPCSLGNSPHIRRSPSESRSQPRDGREERCLSSVSSDRCKTAGEAVCEERIVQIRQRHGLCADDCDMRGELATSRAARRVVEDLSAGKGEIVAVDVYGDGKMSALPFWRLMRPSSHVATPK
jgi:hypothetical protein